MWGRGVCAQFAKLHPDKVFFSAKGFSVRAGFTDAHLPEVEAKECLIASAGLKIALLDSSKFGKEALGTIATTADVDVLITDCEPPEEVGAGLEQHGVPGHRSGELISRSAPDSPGELMS